MTGRNRMPAGLTQRDRISYSKAVFSVALRWARMDNFELPLGDYVVQVEDIFEEEVEAAKRRVKNSVVVPLNLYRGSPRK
jgi:hypothetical protein